MAPPAVDSRPIQIPHVETFGNAYSAPAYEYRRRRRGRHSKIPSPIRHSNSGPSSLGSGSDSSLNSPTAGLRQIASPSDQTLPSRDPRLPGRMNQEHDIPVTPGRKDKAKAVDRPLPPLFPPSTSPLSPSMLESSSYKSINLNSNHDDPDEPPRLITYTKSGQGFTWNDELFLPSYMIGRYGGRNGGRRKQYDGDFGDDEVEVAEIFITDEEAAAMMP